jgi:hypothetical protein
VYSGLACCHDNAHNKMPRKEIRHPTFRWLALQRVYQGVKNGKVGDMGCPRLAVAGIGILRLRFQWHR